jgi:hypothetical protein
MSLDRHRSWLAPLVMACAAGCAGNGQGLDANGQPIGAGGGSSSGGGTGEVTADFESIQENVFTPICSKCHIGGSAPEGLQLDAAHSYNLLVGVPSNEQPNLDRVKAGDPDDSYLVHKIEGLAGISGGQMPLGETPLPEATINAIRQWIANGAPNAPAGMSAVQSFALQGSAPVAGAAVSAPVKRVIVTFTEDLDASLVNATTVMLERETRAADDTPGQEPGADSDIPAPPTRAAAVPAGVRLAEENASVLIITPRVPLEPGLYRVTLRGTGGAPLASLASRTLGTDLSFSFTVENAR